MLFVQSKFSLSLGCAHPPTGGKRTTWSDSETATSIRDAEISEDAPVDAGCALHIIQKLGNVHSCWAREALLIFSTQAPLIGEK